MDRGLEKLKLNPIKEYLRIAISSNFDLRLNMNLVFIEVYK